MDRLVRMVTRRAERSGDPRLHVVAEEWLPKRYDLNYQVTVTRGGGVTLDFVKQALTDNGVHKGHIMPPELSPAGHAQIEEAAHIIGQRLYADGYHGVAGVDAIVDFDGGVYPLLEINARLNMSTYQGGVTERFQRAGQVGPATAAVPLRRPAPRPWTSARAARRRALRGDLLRHCQRERSPAAPRPGTAVRHPHRLGSAAPGQA
jgi:hypothetical protein